MVDILCSDPALAREKPKGLLRAISRLSAAYACNKLTVCTFQELLVAAEKRGVAMSGAGVCFWASC